MTPKPFPADLPAEWREAAKQLRETNDDVEAELLSDCADRLEQAIEAQASDLYGREFIETPEGYAFCKAAEELRAGNPKLRTPKGGRDE